VTFGALLRQLRDDTGTGIKRLAPDLGVSYTYLSKLENDVAIPSEDFVAKVAKYFNYDQSRLLLAAGKVPPDILDILRENPDAALQFLKERFRGKTDANR
jgi:HTH-type transcriptional regulator, competence development regulator